MLGEPTARGSHCSGNLKETDYARVGGLGRAWWFFYEVCVDLPVTRQTRRGKWDLEVLAATALGPCIRTRGPFCHLVINVFGHLVTLQEWRNGGALVQGFLLVRFCQLPKELMWHCCPQSLFVGIITLKRVFLLHQHPTGLFF